MLACQVGMAPDAGVVGPAANFLWLAFAMLCVRPIVTRIGAPVQIAWLNLNLDSASRATVISMTGPANSIRQAVGEPVPRWIGSAVSIQAVLLASAVVDFPTVYLYRRLIPRGHEATGCIRHGAGLIRYE